MKRTTLALVGAVVLAVGWLASPSLAGPATQLTVKETILTTIKPGAVRGSLVISPDGMHSAYIVGQPGVGQRVVLDGQPQGEYGDIFTSTLCFSPDSKRLGYGVGLGKQFGFAVVIDGKQGPAFDTMRPNILGQQIFFSPDSKRVGYTGERKGQCIAVIDGVEGKPHPGVFGGMIWSPDSRRWGMLVAAKMTPSGLEKGSIIIDDVAGRVFDAITTPGAQNEAGTQVTAEWSERAITFSKDGKHVAYTALDGDKVVLIVDGQEIEKIPTKKVIRKGLDGKNVETLDGGIGDLLYSPTGDRLAYQVSPMAGDSWYVVDGKPLPAFPVMAPIGKFSSDGKHFAFLGVKRPNTMTYLDGKEVSRGDAPPEDAGYTQDSIFFSPDGTRLGVVGWKGNKFAVAVNGVEGKPYDDMTRPLFSPDGKHLGFLGGIKGKGIVAVVDGQEGKFYEDCNLPGLVFSPDSQHSAFGALANGKWRVVVDGAETRESYEGFHKDTVRFIGPKTVRAVGYKGPDVVRVDVELESVDLQPLVADLKAADAAARKKAAQTLERLGASARDAAPALAEAIKDKDQAVAEAVISALMAIDPTNKALEGMAVDVLENPGTMTKYRGQNGKTFYFEVTGAASGTVYGTDIYTDDSQLAAVVVHAGILKPGERGIIKVTVMPGQNSYTSTQAHGILSNSYGAWQGSYKVEKSLAIAKPADPLRDAKPDPGTISAFRGQNGKVMYFEVTGSTSGSVWGTGPYTDDSRLATAAVHGGVLKSGQKGIVKVTIMPGQASYQGSTQNGVTTSQYGSFGGSYKVETIDSVAQPVEMVKPVVVGNKKYQVFTDVMTWKEAKAQCEKLGGRLAIVTSQEDNDQLTKLVKEAGLNEAWLGATDEVKEGEWVWVDGSPMTFKNWGPGQPNNKQNREHYLLLWGAQNGKWSDQPDRSTEHRPGFICEMVEGKPTTEAKPEPKPEPKAEEEALLRKASVDGKYTKLLKKIEVPGDKSTYGEFRDYGQYSGTSYAGFDNLPAGYWVYVSPHWYIWGEMKK